MGVAVFLLQVNDFPAPPTNTFPLENQDVIKSDQNEYSIGIALFEKRSFITNNRSQVSTNDQYKTKNHFLQVRPLTTLYDGQPGAEKN